MTYEGFTDGFRDSWNSTPELTSWNKVPRFHAGGRMAGWFLVDIDDLKRPFRDLEEVRDLAAEERANLSAEDLEDDYKLNKKYLKSIEDYAIALYPFLTNTQKTIKAIVDDFSKEFEEFLQDSLQ